ELVRVTASSDNTTWAFVSPTGVFTPPSAGSFQVSAKLPSQNLTSYTVQQVGFKQRPLYSDLAGSDIRVEKSLYLKLSAPLPTDDDSAVEVKNSANLWPANMQFIARNSQLRYSPVIHVNHEGYPIHVKQAGSQVNAPQRAIAGYYCGSLPTLPPQA